MPSEPDRSALACLARVHGVADHDGVWRMYALLRGVPGQQPRSRLTRTGHPLECSVVCADHKVRALRYTIDGTAAIGEPAERLRSADAITKAALTELGSTSGLAMHAAIQANLMEPQSSHPALGDFAIWSGAIHTPDGGCVLKAYYNLRPWRIAPERVRDTLRDLPALGPIDRLWDLDHAPVTWPCFLGVEYDAAGVRATKLYWQRLVPLFANEPRDRIERALVDAPGEVLDAACRTLLDGSAAFPAPAVVVSGKVSPRNDDLEAGLHIALPACVADDDAARARVRVLLDDAALDRSLYDASWVALTADRQTGAMVHSVVAIVLSPRRTRMTVYFDPGPSVGL